MSLFLLDTNVISELARPVPEPRVVAFLAEQATAYLSVITLHEIVFGIERLPMGAQRRVQLSRFLEEFLAHFEDRVLATDEQVARAAGQIRAKAAMAGHTAGLADSLIAATALVHGLTLATRNVADFAPLGALTHNPWHP